MVGRVLRLACRLLACVLALAAAGPAQAQDWPAARPIRFVIPFAPGGLMDTVLGITKSIVEAKLGQRIFVEYKPGAGGNVGAEAVLSSPADGYTILVAPSNVLVTNQFLFSNMPFDPLRDFVPITMLVDVPLVLSVSEKFQPRTLREFIEYGKANPGKMNFGSPGPATPPHLAGEMLALGAGIQAVHVAYKGGNAAATALITNEVQFMIISYASLRGQIQGGLVRAIAVAAPERLSALPAVPTFAESGFRELEAEIPRSWWGLFAAKGTPDAIIVRLGGEFRAALATPEVQARLREAGLIPVGNTSPEFARMLPPQAAKWATIIKSLGLKAE